MVSTSGAVECPACCRWCCRRDCRLDVWNRKDFGSCVSTSLRSPPSFASTANIILQIDIFILMYSFIYFYYYYVLLCFIIILIFIMLLAYSVLRLNLLELWEYNYWLWILWILKITSRINIQMFGQDRYQKKWAKTFVWI